ncbi:hypothetical protein [Nocardia sp. NPDC059239]|uniref:hypothetical protein n=1 Tax=unclassified Nocardia TaxID=2637762 RepID=UPI00369B5F97
MIDVPAKLSAQGRVFATGNGLRRQSGDAAAVSPSRVLERDLHQSMIRTLKG